MFPKVFETTVYTQQLTVSPLDLLVNPPSFQVASTQREHWHWQRPGGEYYNTEAYQYTTSSITPSQATPARAPIDTPEVSPVRSRCETNCTFENEFRVTGSPHNSPTQDEVVRPRPRSQPRRRDLNASSRKAGRRRPRINNKISGSKHVTGKWSEAQDAAMKRRRKKEGDKLCSFPGCTRSFTQKWRLASHYDVIHYGIKKYICFEPDCSYKAGHKWDLKRHRGLMHASATGSQQLKASV